MIGAILRWLPFSLAIHAAALAATSLLPREPALIPLFVDLTLDANVSEARPAGGHRAGDGRAAPAPQRARGATQRPDRGVSTAPPRVPSAGPPSVPPPLATPPAATRQVEASPAATPPVAASMPEPSVVSPGPVTPPDVSAPPAPAAPAIAWTPSSAPPPGNSTGESPGETASWVGNGGGDAAVGTPAQGGGGVTGDVGGAAGSTSASGRGGGRGDGTGEGTLALAIPGEGDGVYGEYFALLRRRVQESVAYPASARRRSVVGTVHLEIAVEASGHIAAVAVVRSSSHSILDEAAVDGVRALRRVPFPSHVRPRPLRVRLPVVFELR